MTITDLLTCIELSGFGGPIGTTHSIGEALPAGALDLSHLEYRSRAVPGLWTGWFKAVAWNQATRVITVGNIDATHTVLQIRRMTPRLYLYQDPGALEARVDRENLRINANQGFMVACEWAGEYGIDPQQSLLQPDYAVSTPLRLLSQTHYGPGPGPDNLFHKKHTYDFWFAGGYIQRAHVKVQAKIAGVWTPVALDSTSWDTPYNPAANKFIGPWTLQLDLQALGDVQGLIIHRFTPRNGEVSYPDTGVPITEINMDPSTRHAFYVAVELGEELSKRVPCECDDYYTTLLYPVIHTDEARILVPTAQSGVIWGVPTDQAKVSSVPSIQSGSLTVQVGQYYMDFPDQAKVSSVPTLQSGSLVVQIITHTMPFPDQAQVSSVPSIQSGSLVVQVVSYTMTSPDQAQVASVPSIQSGSLT